jgi:hypothetical protein
MNFKNISKHVSRYFTFAIICIFCIGCSLIIGKLPTPDPVWKAASGFGSGDPKTGCFINKDNQQDCLTNNQRVTKYLTRFLPSQPNDFAKSLEKINFNCIESSDLWTCNYTKSQAPVPCGPTLRVFIRAVFLNNSIITAKDIKINSTSLPDPDADNRGCFPL